jgi:L-threonylcarbamoyladenylate synthase
LCSQLIEHRLLVPAKKNIVKASESLLSGNLVAFPTETVYGLGASATNEKGINRIYKVKGRPNDHPLIVHVSSVSKLKLWAREIPEYALDLANKFWPGPMTLILKRTETAKDFITGGQDTVGLRIPNNEIALGLLHQFEKIGGLGIAAPSANRFGKVSPTSAQHVESDIGRYLSDSDLILDGGECNIGIESTIIDCTDFKPKVLRPGAISEAAIFLTNSEAAMFLTETEKSYAPKTSETKHSGQFESHYSPNAILNLDTIPNPGDGLIAIDEKPTPDGCIRLAAPKNSKEFAQQLYSALRRGDELKLQRIVVFQPEDDEIGTAIRDRLRKAKTK